jgi:hypothetical protein
MTANHQILALSYGELPRGSEKVSKVEIMRRANVIFLGEVGDDGDGGFNSREGDRVGELPRRKFVVSVDPEGEFECTDAEYEDLFDCRSIVSILHEPQRMRGKQFTATKSGSHRGVLDRLVMASILNTVLNAE